MTTLLLLACAACVGQTRTLAQTPDLDWQPMGCGMGGNTYWLTIDPSDDQTIYWSPDMGGLYKTSDGGKHWKSIGSEFLHQHRGNGTALVTVAPSDSNVIHAFSHLRIGNLAGKSSLVDKYGGRNIGLIQSQDGGETWRAIKGTPHRLGAIAVDPDNANTVWCMGPGFYAASTGVVYRKVYHEPGAGALVMTDDNWQTTSVTYVGCEDAEDGAKKQVAFGSLVVDPSTPFGNRTLYACGNMGVMKSIDNGMSWGSVNKGLDRRDAQMMAIHHNKETNTTTLYVTIRGGGGRGGVYKSLDRGLSWKNVTANLPVQINSGCRNIVIDNRDGDTAYVGMAYKNGSDDGLFKTIDGGASWKRVTFPNGPQKNKDLENCWNQTTKDRVEGLVISQQNPNRLMFADGNCRMFRTDDAGKSWRQTYTNRIDENQFQTRGMEDTCTMGVLVSPYDKDRVYIAEHDFSGLCSFDGGKSFSPTALTGVGKRCGGYAFAIDPKDHDFVCGASNADSNGLFHTSTNGGKTWDTGKLSPGADLIPASLEGEHAEIFINRYINSIVILNDQRTPSRIVITKKTGIFYSDDRGSSWSRAETDIAPDDDFAMKRLYVSKKNPKRIFATAGLLPNDPNVEYCSLQTGTPRNVTELQGGIYRSDDEGQSWNRINTNFHEASVSGLAFDATNEDIIYISTLSYYDNQGSPDYKRKGDGGLYKTTDGGKTWRQLLACRSQIYAGIDDVAVNYNGDIYVVGRELSVSEARAGVYKSSDGGKAWHDITGITAIDRYTSICIDPFDQRKVYVGTYGAGAFRGIDSENRKTH